MLHEIDPASIANKEIILSETIDLLIVGAGPAGVAAAIEAKSQGLAVVLVDENPIPFETAGEDVPFHFGGCMGGDLRNPGRTLELIVENRPDIVEAFEVGVDVRMGTAVLGMFANGSTVGWLPGKVALLCAEEKVTAVRFDQVIVATGRRDMGMAFPGWENPGVMGVTAASLLGITYKALDATSFVMIGSGSEALQAAAALHDEGHICRGIIDVSARARGDAAAVAACEERGIAFHFGARPAQAALDSLSGRVSRLTVEKGGSSFDIACDTVILGVGVVPVIELLDVLGCEIVTDYHRGGHVPRLVDGQQTSIPSVFAVGDCSEIWSAKSLDPEIAREEGRRAARQAAGVAVETSGSEASLADAAALTEARLDWFGGDASSVFKASHVCQCEEVSARAIVEVLPPAYLNAHEVDMDRSSLETVLDLRRVDPDQIKKLTRASMGACQGRRCREQVECLISGNTGTPLPEVPRATYRYPVRPLSLQQLSSLPESTEVAQHWDSWFGMPMQWTPYWNIPDRYTVATCPRGPGDGE